MLEARNVSKSYPTPRGSLSILTDISLALDQGEAISIVGPSGTGKSTLLYILGALEPPTSGTVMLDGRAVCSCLVLGVEAQGRNIATVEGLATNGVLHVLQNKFLEHASLQCGICTPGFLISAKSLLDRNPKPTEPEIRYALAGNLCRCTGYDKIVKAVLDAAADIRSQQDKSKSAA